MQLGADVLAGVPRPSPGGDDLVVCPRFRLGEELVPTVTITQFDAPRNVTIDEVRIELVFPETPVAHDVFTAIGGSVAAPVLH